VPVMVCMDGFILTHAVEQLDLPSQEQVDGFLPRFEPRQVLDPDDPLSIGAMVGPEAFMEVRYLAHVTQMQALDIIPEIVRTFQRGFGRDSGGLVRPYRTEGAETIVVALGSVLGTLKDTIDEMREQGERIGVLGITTFRPWPRDEVRRALAGSKRIVVLEKALAVGIGGIVSLDVRVALSGTESTVHTVIAGLGGRPITTSSLRLLLTSAIRDELPDITFLDLDRGLVERELQRRGSKRKSGPHAENLLRDLGAIAAGAV
jgi:pyruvate ferredoxin oxidoreductase alpha subunit